MDNAYGMSSTENMGSAIEPQYSGNFNAVASMFKRRRISSFSDGHAVKYHIQERHSSFVSKPLIPRDMSTERSMAGMGEFVVDPMQNFRSESLQLDSPTTPSFVNDFKQMDSRQVRSKGRSAYQKNAY